MAGNMASRIFLYRFTNKSLILQYFWLEFSINKILKSTFHVLDKANALAESEYGASSQAGEGPGCIGSDGHRVVTVVYRSDVQAA